MEFFLTIAVIILGIMVFNTRARLSALEQKDFSRGNANGANVQTSVVSEAGKAAIPPTGLYGDFIQQSSAVEVSTIESNIKSIENLPTPNESGGFGSWLKEDLLMKIGALFFVMGIGWFITYAISSGWIGPVGQVTLAFIAGIAFLLVGTWRINTDIKQGGVFLVLGTVIIQMAVAVAQFLYHFEMFTPTISLVVDFLAVLYTSILSIKHRSHELSVLSLIIATTVPIYTANFSDYTFLFNYLMVIVLGVIWVAGVTKWRDLILISLVIVYLYSTPYLNHMASANASLYMLYAFAFVAVFFITHAVSAIREAGEGRSTGVDLFTIVLNGVFLLSWILAVAPKEWQSLLISAWMIVFLVAAFVVSMVSRKRDMFFAHAGVGVGFLLVATAITIDNSQALTLAYIFETAALVFLSHLILKDSRVTKSISWLYILPAIMSVESFISSSWNTGVIHIDFFILLSMCVSLFVTGIFLYEKKSDVSGGGEESASVGTFQIVLGSIYAYALLWLSLHAGTIYGSSDYNVATMFALIVYVVIGVTAYFKGLHSQSMHLRQYGAVLTGAVILRLLLVDVWQMDRISKIITFLIIGTFLISTAFIRKHRGNVIKAE